MEQASRAGSQPSKREANYALALTPPECARAYVFGGGRSGCWPAS